MKTQGKKLGQFIAALLCVGLTLFSSGCAHSRVYPISFERSEAALLSRLRIDKRKLSSSGGTSAHADQTLARYMTMEDYSVELHAYDDGRHLRFTAYNDYNIGGWGAQKVLFDLTKLDDERTRITVDFSDASLSLFVIPYCNPGVIRERRIAEEIFEVRAQRVCAWSFTSLHGRHCH